MSTPPDPQAGARALRRGALGAAGLATGFGLSFVALGLLWVGVPWGWQALMVVPCLGAAFVLCRCGGAVSSLLAGMLPIGALFVQFRDTSGSHASSVALVAAWGLAAWAGSRLARRGPSRGG